MSRILVNLEIILETEELLLSEIETAIHKMLRSVKDDVSVMGYIYDYGLDMNYMD